MSSKSEEDFLEFAKKTFRQEFGRAPNARDRVTSAAYLYAPDELDEAFVSGALAADIPGHLVYATRLTGIVLSDRNLDKVDPEDRDAFQQAVERYFRAAEHGIDLNAIKSRTEKNIEEAKKIIELGVIHLGSYCDKAPKKTSKDQALFFQFLLISQCFQCLKSIKDRFGNSRDFEIFQPLRQLFECSLVFASLSNDPKYSAALMAQALAGTEHYPYRLKRDGRPDHAKIIDASTGSEFPSRTSFAERASKISLLDKELYDVVYPDLSSGAHFDSLTSMVRYSKNESFLDFGRSSKENQVVRIILIVLYFIDKILQNKAMPRIITRDASFLRDRILAFLVELRIGFDVDDINIDENWRLMLEEVCEQSIKNDLRS